MVVLRRCLRAAAQPGGIQCLQHLLPGLTAAPGLQQVCARNWRQSLASLHHTALCSGQQHGGPLPQQAQLCQQVLGLHQWTAGARSCSSSSSSSSSSWSGATTDGGGGGAATPPSSPSAAAAAAAEAGAAGAAAAAAQQAYQALGSTRLKKVLYSPLVWNELASSKLPSRKPAIKAPARHQWHYCAPDYDPMMPLPQQPLPPYAPLYAAAKDYRATYARTRPKHNRRRYWRVWAKNAAITDQRWRQAWEKKMAAERKEAAAIERVSARLIRQRSWEMWQLQQAGVEAGGGGGGAAGAVPAAAAAAAAASPAGGAQ